MTTTPAERNQLADADPVRDATVLLIGRGAAYPALSVSLGERMGIVGALSIEAAAKHLNARDIDGIILGEGFSGRVMDAFLTVLAEDARFRNLPVVVTADGLTPAYDLPNLEFITGAPEYIAANALPLIRQHALEAHLSRTLAIDRCRWSARRPQRIAHLRGLRSRPRHRGLSNAVARRRLVGGSFCLRSGPSSVRSLTARGFSAV